MFNGRRVALKYPRCSTTRDFQILLTPKPPAPDFLGRNFQTPISTIRVRRERCTATVRIRNHYFIYHSDIRS